MTEKEKAIRGSKYYREFKGDGLTHDEGDYDNEEELADDDNLDECGDKD